MAKISQYTEGTPVSGDFVVFVDSSEGATKKAEVDSLPVSSSVTTALDGKVDKVTGKQLSEENYTTAEKSKLISIEEGAQVNNMSYEDATDLTDGGDTTLHTHDSRYYTESETDTLLSSKMDESVYDPSGTARQVAFACTVQSAITDYTFTGTEPTSSGYLVTTASNRTVNINADLFTTGYEVIFCKGTDNTNTVTLDAGSGNNINGSQTYILDKYNETVVLVKDGDSTWKIKAGNVPKSTLVQTTGDQSISGNKNFANVLYVDNTNNRVGVGTTTPNAGLNVKSSAQSSFLTEWTSSDNQRIAGVYEESDTRGTLSLYNAGATQTVRLETNGNSYLNGGSLGIGMTTPLFSSGSGIGIYDAATPRLKLFNLTSGSAASDGFDFTILGADAYIINRENGNMLFLTNNVERMRINQIGNIGIGETNPDYKLDVNGSFGFTPGIGTTITPVDNGDIVFEATSNTAITVKMKGSDGVIRSTTLTLS